MYFKIHRQPNGIIHDKKTCNAFQIQQKAPLFFAFKRFWIQSLQLNVSANPPIFAFNVQIFDSVLQFLPLRHQFLTERIRVRLSGINF